MKGAAIVATLCALLAACGDADKAGGASGSGGAGQDMVECAIGAGAAMARICAVEREGVRLTIHHPDGGFRRFDIVPDGRGVEAADGAERAQLQIIEGSRLDIIIGDDHYRLPVTLARQGP